MVINSFSLAHVIALLAFVDIMNMKGTEFEDPYFMRQYENNKEISIKYAKEVAKAIGCEDILEEFLKKVD